MPSVFLGWLGGIKQQIQNSKACVHDSLRHNCYHIEMESHKYEKSIKKSIRITQHSEKAVLIVLSYVCTCEIWQSYAHDGS